MDQMELLISRYPVLASCKEQIEGACTLLIDTYKKDGKVLACGNGGSASDAAHIVGELMKSFTHRRGIGEVRDKLYDTLPKEDAAFISENLEGALAAVSLLGETSLISAYANDVSPEMIYAQQVLGLGRNGDSLIGITTSGNSKNVVRAVQTAKALGMHTIGLTGESGGLLKEYCDVCICVPEKETYKVQELHLPVYHAICLIVEEYFFPEPRY